MYTVFSIRIIFNGINTSFWHPKVRTRMHIPSMICRCFVMMSSVMRCCRCILCNRSPRRRNSYDSTSRSPCNAILSASNSCTRHISDSSSRSVSESKRFGRFYGTENNSIIVNQTPLLANAIFSRLASITLPSSSGPDLELKYLDYRFARDQDFRGRRRIVFFFCMRYT